MTPEPADAELFAALGDATRLGLLARLGRDGPTSIVALSEGAAMSRQAITKHLYVLEGAGLVTCARLGRSSLWRIERQRIETAKGMLDALSAQWDDALQRLRRHVEG